MSRRFAGLLPTSVLLVAVVAHASGAALWHAPKKLTIRGRIVAQGPSIPLVTIGLNRDNYVFALESKTGRAYVKLSYRFLLYEPRIPNDLFDYQMLLSFSAVRDKSCDEPVRLLGTNADGFSLSYAPGAPELPPADAVLPCYVVTSRDYKGAHRRPLAPPVQAQTDHGGSGPGTGPSMRQ